MHYEQWGQGEEGGKRGRETEIEKSRRKVIPNFRREIVRRGGYS